MIPHLRMPLFSSCCFATLLPGPVYAQVPSAIAVPGQNIRYDSSTAEGAQAMNARSARTRSWFGSSRADRHPSPRWKDSWPSLRGTNWDFADGSFCDPKPWPTRPGRSPNDILWLKLEVTSQRGDGGLYGVTSVAAHQHQGRHGQGRAMAWAPTKV